MVGIVPLLSACLYQWDPDKIDFIERTELEMTPLREFVMQPLPNPAFVATQPGLSTSDLQAPYISSESEDENIVYSTDA